MNFAVSALESSDWTVMAVLFVFATICFLVAAARWAVYPFVLAVGLALCSTAFAWWAIFQT